MFKRHFFLLSHQKKWTKKLLNECPPHDSYLTTVGKRCCHCHFSTFFQPLKFCLGFSFFSSIFLTTPDLWAYNSISPKNHHFLRHRIMIVFSFSTLCYQFEIEILFCCLPQFFLSFYFYFYFMHQHHWKHGCCFFFQLFSRLTLAQISRLVVRLCLCSCSIVTIVH